MNSSKLRCQSESFVTLYAWTAVTLYSGQFVAQSEFSVVTTFAPDSGKWNVVYTTPGATRPLYADFLAEAGRGDAATAYREAGKQWSRVATAAVQHRPLAELAELVAQAVRLEEQGVDLLRR